VLTSLAPPCHTRLSDAAPERVEAMWSTWQSPKNPALSPALSPAGKGLTAGIVAHFNGTQPHEITQSQQRGFADAAGLWRVIPNGLL
jgi:hypothetical protein